MSTILEQTKAMVTFSKLFTGTQEEFDQVLPIFLIGDLDEHLIAYQVRQGYDEEKAREIIQSYKNFFLDSLTEIIDNTVSEENIKDIHKPNKNGTTAEIAAHLNMSKSEVRKLRREGKLDEVFEESL